MAARILIQYSRSLPHDIRPALPPPPDTLRFQSRRSGHWPRNRLLEAGASNVQRSRPFRDQAVPPHTHAEKTTLWRRSPRDPESSSPGHSSRDFTGVTLNDQRSMAEWSPESPKATAQGAYAWRRRQKSFFRPAGVIWSAPPWPAERPAGKDSPRLSKELHLYPNRKGSRCESPESSSSGTVALSHDVDTAFRADTVRMKMDLDAGGHQDRLLTGDETAEPVQSSTAYRS